MVRPGKPVLSALLLLTPAFLLAQQAGSSGGAAAGAAATGVPAPVTAPAAAASAPAAVSNPGAAGAGTATGAPAPVTSPAASAPAGQAAAASPAASAPAPGAAGTTGGTPSTSTPTIPPLQVPAPEQLPETTQPAGGQNPAAPPPGNPTGAPGAADGAQGSSPGGGSGGTGAAGPAPGVSAAVQGTPAPVQGAATSGGGAPSAGARAARLPWPLVPAGRIDAVRVSNPAGTVRGQVRDLALDGAGSVRFIAVQLDVPGASAGALYLVPAARVRAAAVDRLTLDLADSRLRGLMVLRGDRFLPAFAPLLASRLAGAAALDPQGRDLGRVEDLAVDLSRMRALYLAVLPAAAQGAGQPLYAVPFSAFRGWDPRTHQARLDLSGPALRASPAFSPSGAWPRVVSRGQAAPGP